MALTPLVLAHADGATLLGCEHPELAAGAGLRAVQGWLRAASATPLIAFPVGRYLRGPEIVVVPVPADAALAPVALVPRQRRRLHAARHAFVWCALAALAGCPSSDSAARAVAGVCGFARPVALLSTEVAASGDDFGGFVFGQTGLMPLTPFHTLASSLVTPLAQAARAAWLGEAALRDALLGAIGAGSADLHSWAPRVRPLDLDGLPPELLGALPDFSAPRLASLAFTPIYAPLSSTWLAREPARPPRGAPPPLCLTTLFDLIASSRKKLEIEAWLDRELADLEVIASDPGVGLHQRSRPPILTVAQSHLYPWARGDV